MTRLACMLAAAALACAWNLQARAQLPAPEVSSDPLDLILCGDFLIWSADDGIHGRELWGLKMDENQPRMLMDIAPGADSSEPRGFFKQDNGNLFFSAWTPQHGRELWFLFLGAPLGELAPRLVRDIEPGPYSSEPRVMMQSGRATFLYASTITYGREPWISDTLPDGTALLLDVMPGDSSSNLMIYEFGVRNGRFNFLALDGKSHGPHLWSSDGTQAGTVPGVELSADISGMMELNGIFVIGQKTGKDDFELWRTDGTPEGTVLLKDINPGDSPSRPRNFYRYKDLILFQADTPEAGGELWRTDGTPEGTRLIKDISPGAGSSDPHAFMLSNDRVYFRAEDGANGIELWRTDGTADGTQMVHDIFAGPASSTPYAMTSLGEELLFSAREAEHGEELWITGGDAQSTRMLRDINPGPAGSEPYFTVASLDKGTAFFSAITPDHGCELWSYTIVDGATKMVADVMQLERTNPASAPRDLVRLGTRVLFAANDIQHGDELWAFELEGLKTYMVKDIFPGTPSSSPQELTAVGSFVFFRADDGAHGDELWRSDGTEAGTAICGELESGAAGSAPAHITAGGDSVYFTGFATAFGAEPCIAAPPNYTPERLADIVRGPGSSNPRHFMPLETGCIFTADDGVHGEELWMCQLGQPPRMLRDIATEPLRGASLRDLTPASGGFIFAASSDAGPRSLWRFRIGEAVVRIPLFNR